MIHSGDGHKADCVFVAVAGLGGFIEGFLHFEWNEGVLFAVEQEYRAVLQFVEGVHGVGFFFGA